MSPLAPTRPTSVSTRAVSTRFARLVAGVLAALMVLLGMQSMTAGSASASPVPLACDPDTVFGISSSGLSAVNVTTGAVSAIATMPHATNGLGVSLGGTHAYAFSNGSTNVMDDYDAATGVVSSVNAFDTGTAGAIRGAVDPTTGLFYYGGGNSTAGGVTTIRVGAYDPATGTRLGQVATISSAASGSGGDFAFTRDGTMFVLIGTSVERVNQTMPTVSGNAALATTPVTVLTGISASPGLAFAASGYLYANSGTDLYKINPVSGAVVGSPVTMSGGFSPSDLASCTYPNTLAGSADVRERMQPGDQFAVSLSGGGLAGTSGTTSGSSTGARRVAGPVLGLGGSSYTVTQSMASGSAADYTTAYACTAGGTTVASGTAPTASASATFTMPTGGSSDASCTFTNTPVTATLAVSVTLGGARADGTDQFSVAVRAGSTALSSASGATTTGAGGTVGAGSGTTGTTTVVATRGYDLVTTMATGAASVLAQYASVITCTDANGLQTGLPTGDAYSGTLTVVPVPGAAITCAITATAVPPTVTVLAALSGPRVVDTDQFTVGLRAGAGGAAIGTPGTTSGTGSAITAGAGSSGPAVLTPGQAVAVTGAPTAHAAAYDAHLTCTDANGFQSGLPTAASFTGSAPLAPVAGAALVCTVTTGPDASTLAVAGAFGSARYDDGDQVTVAVRTGGPAGTVVNPTGAATTAGSGAAVTAGSGTTGVVTTAPGTAYTITADLSGHSALYGSTITCNDAHGLQTGLPTAAAFAGSLQLTPRAGSAISCAVTTTLLPPVAPAPLPPVATAPRLELGIDGPGHLTVGVPAPYLVTVSNTGSAGAGTTTVAVTLPAGMRFAAATGASCTAAGQQVTCRTAGPIAAGDLTTFVLTAVPQRGIAAAVRLRGAVDPAGAEPADPAVCTATDAATGCAVSGALTAGTATLLLSGSAVPLAPARASVVAGDRIAYRYTVTDTGVDDLERLAVTAPGVGALTCARTSLAAGETTTCAAAPSRVTQAEVDAGTIEREAVAVAVPVGCVGPDCAAVTSNRADTVVPMNSTARISTDQSVRVADTNHDGVANAGEVAHFTVVVTNTGTITLHGLRLLDPGVSLTCPSQTLAVGASMRCTGSRVVTDADVAAGRIVSLATASATGAGTLEHVRDASSAAVATAPARTGAQLASTGWELFPTVGGGVLLLLAGAGLLLLTRRRRA